MTIITKMNKLEIAKWTGTVFLVTGFGLVSAGMAEFIFLQLLGGFIWMSCAIYMKDLPLTIVNLVMTLAGISGYLFKTFS